MRHKKVNGYHRFCWVSIIRFFQHTYDVMDRYFPKRESNANIQQQTDIANTLPYRFFLQSQNNRYVIATIRLKDDVYANVIYDKSTDECKFINPFSESVEFKPIIVTNEFVLSYCYHGQVEQYFKEEILDDDNKQKFRKLLDEKDEMNPIIIKYYFK